MTDVKCPLPSDRLKAICAEAGLLDSFAAHPGVKDALRQAAIESYKIGRAKGFSAAYPNKV